MWPTSVCQLLPRNSSVVLFSIQCNFCSPSTSSPRIAAVVFCVFTQLRWLFWSVICAVENPVTFELAHFNTVIFPMTVTKKIWQGATSRRKGLLGLVIWANRIGVTSAGKSQEHEANDCAESAVRKQRDKAGAHLASFWVLVIQSQMDPSPQDVTACIHSESSLLDKASLEAPWQTHPEVLLINALGVS